MTGFFMGVDVGTGSARAGIFDEAGTLVGTIDSGKPSTPFMSFGNRIRIEMLVRDGANIFGAIDQQVVRYEGA